MRAAGREMMQNWQNYAKLRLRVAVVSTEWSFSEALSRKSERMEALGNEKDLCGVYICFSFVGFSWRRKSNG